MSYILGPTIACFLAFRGRWAASLARMETHATTRQYGFGDRDHPSSGSGLRENPERSSSGAMVGGGGGERSGGSAPEGDGLGEGGGHGVFGEQGDGDDSGREPSYRSVQGGEGGGGSGDGELPSRGGEPGRGG